jgi:uncharacterized membrane protein
MTERLRASLFFVPMIAVILATVLGFVGLAVDQRIETEFADLPLGFSSTVESARSVLGVIAGATISFAGIAFSVSLLIIQLASSQYSPRVVHTLFRDPFNKRVMALVVGTFTYCVVVLRSVRSAIEPGGDPVIPNLSVAVAVVLGIATILAIVAFIDHSAHAMDVSEILERIRRDTTAHIRSEWTPTDPGSATGPGPSAERMPPASLGSSTVIRAHRSGWVQQIDTEALLEVIPDATTARVDTYAGRYVIEHEPLVVLAPAVDADGVADAAHAVRATFVIGTTRTMQQDVTYGLRQLVDVAVKALSPGINDPTTAEDAILHAGAVLSELLRHDPPPALMLDGGRRLVLAHQPVHRDLVRLAFDETRHAAAMHPAVCVYLLRTIASLIESLEATGLAGRTDELHRQARLVAAGCGRTDVLADDLDDVRRHPVLQLGDGPDRS